MTTHTPIILPFGDKLPRAEEGCFIAPGATVIGDVEIGAGSSIWFGAVIRGDVQSISIGSRTNVQDGTVIHVTRGNGPTSIGSGVTIGHSAMLHACTVEDGCFIGMRAVMLDFSTVQRGGMLAAGAVLTPGKTVPTGEIWAGNPARKLRDMTQQEREYIAISEENYVRLAAQYMGGFTPPQNG